MVTATRREANGVVVGDVKQGYQKEDHGGWYKLDGRAVGSLPDKAIQSAFALGIPGLLPNMDDKTVYGSFSDTIVGQVSGGNLINRASLPNVGLSFSGTSSANNRGHTHQVDPPATASGHESSGHTHSIPALSGSTTSEPAVSGSSQVPLASFEWTADWGGDQGGSGRTYPYVSGSRTVSSSTLTHSHNVTTVANTTGERSVTHTHTTDIPEFTSKSESQNHTHAYSGTTTSMNGGVTQLPFMPAHLKLNYFVYLGE